MWWWWIWWLQICCQICPHFWRRLVGGGGCRVSCFFWQSPNWGNWLRLHYRWGLWWWHLYWKCFWGQIWQCGMTLIVCLLQLHFWQFQEFSALGESSCLKILYIEFSDKFLFIAYFFSLLYFQDFFNLCYFPGFLRFLWGFCVGARVIVAVWECGIISWVMSSFPAPKAAAFPDAFLPFFLDEFFWFGWSWHP